MNFFPHNLDARVQSNYSHCITENDFIQSLEKPNEICQIVMCALADSAWRIQNNELFGRIVNKIEKIISEEKRHGSKTVKIG